MSKIMTLTDLKQSDEQKIKNTIMTLNNQVRDLKIDEFKNKRYISALEEQIKQLSKQLKQLNQKPQLDIVGVLKELNDATVKERGLTKEEIDKLDKQIEQKIKELML